MKTTWTAGGGAGVEEALQDGGGFEVDVVEVEDVEPVQRGVVEDPGSRDVGGDDEAGADLGGFGGGVQGADFGAVELSGVGGAGGEVDDPEG